MVAVQVRCTLKAANGLAEDDCVNTFAIDWPVVGQNNEDIVDMFHGFYSEDPAPLTIPVDNYINNSILRTDGLEVSLVASPQTPPNAPYYETRRTLGAAGSTTSLPQEVALCSSIRGPFGFDSDPGASRQRGRVYIGPLAANAANTTAGVARPTDAFVDVLATATAQLAARLELAGGSLRIWSRADNGFHVVVGGWVDDEFDTQRRRGRKRTERVMWGATVA